MGFTNQSTHFCNKKSDKKEAAQSVSKACGYPQRRKTSFSKIGAMVGASPLAIGNASIQRDTKSITTIKTTRRLDYGSLLTTGHLLPNFIAHMWPIVFPLYSAKSFSSPRVSNERMMVVIYNDHSPAFICYANAWWTACLCQT